MKKLQKIFLMIFVMSCILLIPNKSVSAANIESVTATGNSSSAIVSGVAQDGVTAVSIFVYDSESGDLVIIESAEVSNYHTFSHNIRLASGTYKIKVADYEGGPFKETEVTVQAAIPPHIPSNPTEDYTIPVQGDGTVQIEAEIKDGTATIDEISKENLDKIVENDGTDKITIDLSGAKKDVTGVIITKTTADAIYNIIEDKSNNVKSIEIKLSDSIVLIDAKALKAISDQATGDELSIVVNNTSVNNLSVSQQSVLKDYNVFNTFEAYIENNGARISSFDGGNITISIPFTPEVGKDAKYYHVYHVANDGKLTQYSTKFIDGHLVFTTTHFSDFAIIYDDTRENDTNAKIISVVRMYNTVSGDHFYTANINEADNADKNSAYVYESKKYFSVSGSKEVYSLYNTRNGDHFYTLNAKERDNAIKKAGYVYEGVRFKSNISGKPVYRSYNIYNGDHFYTTSVGEMKNAKKFGYNYEGVAFYVD